VGGKVGLVLGGCLLAAGVTLWKALPERRSGSARIERRVEETATQPQRRLKLEAAVAQAPSVQPTAVRAAAPEPTVARVDRQFVPLGSGPVRGPATAKVTILEFVDYGNRACAQLEGTLERVMWIYRDDVRLQIVHRPTEADAEGVLAARIALAAEAQHKFWDAHYALVTRMQRLTEAGLADLAEGLGLDLAQLESDRGSLAVTAQLEIDAETAKSLRVTESPTLFINGRKVMGAQPFATLSPIIDEEIATADALLQRGVAPEQLYNEILERGSSGTPNSTKGDKR
jgi:protein-disulfide isomerase